MSLLECLDQRYSEVFLIEYRSLINAPCCGELSLTAKLSLRLNLALNLVGKIDDGFASLVFIATYHPIKFPSHHINLPKIYCRHLKRVSFLDTFCFTSPSMPGHYTDRKSCKNKPRQLHAFTSCSRLALANTCAEQFPIGKLGESAIENSLSCVIIVY